MFKQLLVSLILVFVSILGFAFNKDECKEIAENIYGAQSLLNSSPEVFAKATEQIKGQKAEDMDWSEAQKQAILGIAQRLKPGNDPVEVATQVFNSCKNTV